MFKPRPSLEERVARHPLGEFFIQWDNVYRQDVKELERVIASARDERTMQRYLEAHPYLMIQHLGGGHGRFVIPQKRLGAEFVPDFLLCEIDSIGPHWKLVEIESPRGLRAKKNGEPTAHLQHAINQIQDWRRWLTEHIAYAREGLKLEGISGNVPGLVIMGRRGDGADPERLRQILEQNRIEVHSYDWLLTQFRERFKWKELARKVKRPPPSELKFRHFRSRQPRVNAAAAAGGKRS